MTTDPASTFPHLSDPGAPAIRRRLAVACRSSAIVLDREGQPETAASLRTRAELLDPTTNDADAHCHPFDGDAA